MAAGRGLCRRGGIATNFPRRAEIEHDPILRLRMHKIIAATLVLVVSLVLVACGSDNSADSRLRRILGISESQQLTEELVVERVAALLPLGTPEPTLAQKASAAGIGRDALSSYNLIKDRNLVAVRIEYDVSTFAVTKSQWIISLQLDSSRRLQSIGAKRHIAGI